MPKPPPISIALMEWLEGLFPDRLPNDAPSERHAAVLVGEQRVVRKIRSAHQLQSKNILEA